jgi:hypothetical protein
MGIKKIQHLTLISKMLTYLSDKMHPKKVLDKKRFLDLDLRFGFRLQIFLKESEIMKKPKINLPYYG